MSESLPAPSSTESNNHLNMLDHKIVQQERKTARRIMALLEYAHGKCNGTSIGYLAQDILEYAKQITNGSESTLEIGMAALKDPRIFELDKKVKYRLKRGNGTVAKRYRDGRPTLESLDEELETMKSEFDQSQTQPQQLP